MILYDEVFQSHKNQIEVIIPEKSAVYLVYEERAEGYKQIKNRWAKIFFMQYFRRCLGENRIGLGRNTYEV